MHNEILRETHFSKDFYLFGCDAVESDPVAYRGGVLEGSNPPEIPKALQNRAKLNPIVKTVKNG